MPRSHVLSLCSADVYSIVDGLCDHFLVVCYKLKGKRRARTRIAHFLVVHSDLFDMKSCDVTG
jgi:hypothetical protein